MRLRHIVFSLFCSLSLSGLLACNGNDARQPLSFDNRPTPSATPTPTATPVPTPTGTVTPVQLYKGPADVEKYVLKFIDDAKIQGLDVLPDMKNPLLEIRIAKLDALGSSVIGLCETAGTLRRVTFDPDFWNAVSETQRELLAHHELGHCVLYRRHRSDLMSTGAYASIMYPIIMGSTTYKNNYAYYQEELFTWSALELEDKWAQREITHVCDGTHI